MNMRNINVITALSVPGKTVSDDFIHAVFSHCAKNRTSCTGEIRF
ncbi:TPA: conjugal transfer protein TrbD [Escherichia coli]|nr:conjugal transfer protein TrbD [Escherichia coli]